MIQSRYVLLGYRVSQREEKIRETTRDRKIETRAAIKPLFCNGGSARRGQIGRLDTLILGLVDSVSSPDVARIAKPCNHLYVTTKISLALDPFRNVYPNVLRDSKRLLRTGKRMSTATDYVSVWAMDGQSGGVISQRIFLPPPDDGQRALW